MCVLRVYPHHGLLLLLHKIVVSYTHALTHIRISQLTHFPYKYDDDDDFFFLCVSCFDITEYWVQRTFRILFWENARENGFENKNNNTKHLHVAQCIEHCIGVAAFVLSCKGIVHTVNFSSSSSSPFVQSYNYLSSPLVASLHQHIYILPCHTF